MTSGSKKTRFLDADEIDRVEGVPVLVVGAEYLIAMKMVAGRPKDDADLEFLLSDGGVDLDAPGRSCRSTSDPTQSTSSSAIAMRSPGGGRAERNN